MSEIFLSVIIPVHNAGKFLDRCLNSVFAESLDPGDYEVICVDDFSTDDSAEKIRAFQQNHPNLIYLKTPENLRAGGARNSGLRHARGKYIFFLDADDYFHPGALKKGCDRLKDHPVDILIGNFSRELAGSVSNEFVHHYASQEVHTPDEYRKHNGFFPHGPCQWFFLRTLAVDNDIFFREKVSSEDVGWTHRLAIKAKTIQYQPIFLTHYVLHENSQTAKSFSPFTVYNIMLAVKELIAASTLYQDPINKRYVLDVGVIYAKTALKLFLAFCDDSRKKAQMIKDTLSAELALPFPYDFCFKHPFFFARLSNLSAPLVRLLLKIRSIFKNRGISKLKKH